MEGSVYLKARQEWDERYADLVLGKRNWQIAAAGMMAIALVLALGMVWLSTRSKFVPYVVEVDKLGYALAAPAVLLNSRAASSRNPTCRPFCPPEFLLLMQRPIIRTSLGLTA